MSQVKIRNDIAGQKFGKLTAVGPTNTKSGAHYVWEFSCACGGPDRVYKTVGNIRRAAVTECIECYKKTRADCGGAVVLGRIKEHNAWRLIKVRCYDKNVPEYKYYGAKGVKMCSQWLESFENFYESVGPAPSKEHSIDRIDSNGDYEPCNVRWATWVEQSNNRSNVAKYLHNGVYKTLPEICRELGLNYNFIRQRVKYQGWALDAALKEPPTREKFTGDKFFGEKGERLNYRTYLYKGKQWTIPGLAKEHQVSVVMLQQRVRQGWHLEAALTYRNLSNV